MMTCCGRGGDNHTVDTATPAVPGKTTREMRRFLNGIGHGDLSPRCVCVEGEHPQIVRDRVAIFNSRPKCVLTGRCWRVKISENYLERDLKVIDNLAPSNCTSFANGDNGGVAMTATSC